MPGRLAGAGENASSNDEPRESFDVRFRQIRSYKGGCRTTSQRALSSRIFDTYRPRSGDTIRTSRHVPAANWGLTLGRGGLCDSLKGARGQTYTVRWEVAGRTHPETFKTKALAVGRLAELRTHAQRRAVRCRHRPSGTGGQAGPGRGRQGG